MRLAERLRRLGRAYLDGLFPDQEYRRQKHALEVELESLIVPEVDAAAEAGRLITQLPELWSGATLSERHELLVRMLDGVYVDMKGCRSVVAIKPKPAFKAVMQVATTKAGSGVTLIQKEPSRSARNGFSQKSGSAGSGPDSGSFHGLNGSSGGSSIEHMCSWWRRGRVELPVQVGNYRSVMQTSVLAPLRMRPGDKGFTKVTYRRNRRAHGRGRSVQSESLPAALCPLISCGIDQAWNHGTGTNHESLVPASGAPARARVRACR